MNKTDKIICDKCFYRNNCQYLAKKNKSKFVVSCTCFKDGEDIVNVVRCKDCQNNPGLLTRTKGTVWCRHWRKEVLKDGFCNYGARMDGKPNDDT